MLLFAQGLLNRKHEWLLAVDVEVQPDPQFEPEIVHHVLHNVQNPLQATKRDIEFIQEDLVIKLKQQGLKPVELYCVDLGPMGSALNRANKLQYIPRVHGHN